MNLKFFCKVIEKTAEYYNVELNSFNMTELPEGSITLRKVYYQGDLPLALIYVSNSVLEVTDTTKKLKILDFFVLNKHDSTLLSNTTYTNVVMEQDISVSEKQLPNTSVLTEEVKRMILDSKFVPADIYK